MMTLSSRPNKTPQQSQGLFSGFLQLLSKPNRQAMSDNLRQFPNQIMENKDKFTPGNLFGGNQAELGQIASQSLKNPVARNVVEGVNRIPGAFVEGASMGVVKPLKDKPAQTPGASVAEVGGNIAGLVAPGSAVNMATKAIKSTGAFKPFQQVMGKMAGQQIAKGGVNKLAGKAIGNVSQGLPFTAGYAAAKTATSPVTGEGYSAGELATDTAVDIAMSPIPILGLMAGKGAKGFKGSTQFSALTDKLPRFEIDDSGAKLMSADKIKQISNPKLGDILDHPKLFEQYPQLKDIPVKNTPNSREYGKITSSYKGIYNPQTNTISIDGLLNPYAPLKEKTSTLLHEIQHAIQEIEGFARGGNPEIIKKAIDDIVPLNRAKFAREYYDQARQLNPNANIETLVKQADELYQKDFGASDKLLEPMGEMTLAKLITSPKEVIDKQIADSLSRYGLSPDDLVKQKSYFPDEKAFKLYQILSGELEARAVQRRMDMPADQRGRIDPYAEEAIATTGRARPDEFITRFDGGSSANQSNVGGVDPSVLALYTKTQLNQIQQTIHKMIQVGKQQQTNFAKTIKSLADTLQLKHGVGPIKEESSVFRKSLTDEGGKTENIKDINRGVIFVQDFDIAHQDIIMQAQKILGQDVERVKQDINGPLFRKTIINIKGSLGQTTEIQFTTEAMWKAKLELGGDELYHQYRITPKNEKEKLNQLSKKMERLYQAAYRNELDKYTP